MSEGRTFWQEFYDRHAPRYDENPFTQNTRVEVDFLFEVMSLRPGMTLLDVGCGTGRHAVEMARRGLLVTGIDISEGMLEQARRRAAEAGALPLAGATIDLVFSNLMLHWHPAPHTVLAECKRVLRNDGMLLFSCFGPDTGKQLRAACAAALPDARPFPFLDMHDFGDMLVAAGFAVPVMDVDVLTLTFESPRALLREVAALGGNPRDDRRASLVSTRQAHALIDALEAQRDAAGRIPLTFEVAYGRARKRQPQTAGATRISVDRLRADLAARRR